MIARLGLAITLALGALACHGDTTTLDAAALDAAALDAAPPDAGVDAAPRTCTALTDTGCLEVVRGETTYYRFLGDYTTIEFDDNGTTRTVVPLGDLIDAEVAPVPADWRYQIYGSDGYVFPGYATWTNMQNGYIEVGTRKVVWDTSQALPDSWRVKDSYRIVLSPAGG